MELVVLFSMEVHCELYLCLPSASVTSIDVHFSISRRTAMLCGGYQL